MAKSIVAIQRAAPEYVTRLSPTCCSATFQLVELGELTDHGEHVQPRHLDAAQRVVFQPSVLNMSLPTLCDPDSIALFCDFDGTLVDIAPRPDQVRLSTSTHRTIESLAGALGGAFAIVTGRDIPTVDDILAPLKLPIAGVHGLMRRDAAGIVHGGPPVNGDLARVSARIEAFAAGKPALLVEHKLGGISLHYRAAPELEAACVQAVEAAINDTSGLAIRRGKMIVEVAHNGVHKGAAIEAFMAEPPFAERRPVFAGDDLTDEDGFAIVNRIGGVSIKIGNEPTCATYRSQTTAEFHAWLADTAEQISRRPAS